MKSKFLSPALFAVVIISFALPFASITCGGETIATFSGFELITGKEIDLSEVSQQTGMESTGQEKTASEMNIPALLALICAVAGVGLYFVKKLRRPLVPTLLAAAGAVFLFLIKSGGKSAGTGEEQMMSLMITYEIGFYIALFGFLGVLVHQLVEYSTKPTEPAAAPPPVTPPVDDSTNKEN